MSAFLPLENSAFFVEVLRRHILGENFIAFLSRLYGSGEPILVRRFTTTESSFTYGQSLEASLPLLYRYCHANLSFCRVFPRYIRYNTLPLLRAHSSIK